MNNNPLARLWISSGWIGLKDHDRRFLVVAENYDSLDTVFIHFVALDMFQPMLFFVDESRITVV